MQAVRATLEKIRASGDLPEEAAEALSPAIRFAERSIDTGKGAALVRVLAGAAEPSVVFTRFRATCNSLFGVCCDFFMNECRTTTLFPRKK